MINYIREELFSLVDIDYQKFSSKLLPGVNNILGVRLPNLRILAKKIVLDNWEYFLNMDNLVYFEEIMLQGLVIGYVDIDLKRKLYFCSNFIPKISNWSVCDTFCASLKIYQKDLDIVWRFLYQYLYSENEFYIRFGIVMILKWFVNKQYIIRVFNIFEKIKCDAYYDKMAVAWAISAFYVKFPKETINFLNSSKLDDFTFNKSLQKIRELKCMTIDQKIIINNMKRKSNI